MEAEMTSTAGPLAPVSSGERIVELDVVRGFALIGVFLMNVEFFNRPMAGIGEGMPPGLTGIDWLASWFIAYFVQGKFWLIFSLLFGMGFAVMLSRAERAGRAFLVPYLRRITALAVFGAAHFLFVWSGDILFSYAVAAGALLILLFGTWKWITVALVVLVGVAVIARLGDVGRIASSLALVALLALYLRSERKIRIRGRAVPVFSFLLLVIGVLGVIAAGVLWALPHGPEEPRIPVTVAAVVVLAISWVSARYHDPVERRSLRLGVALYLLLSLVITGVGAVQYLTPPDPDDPVTQAAGATSATSGTAAAGTPDRAAAKRATKKAERAQELAEHLEDTRTEERILSTGTWLEGVGLRAREFPKKVANDAAAAVVLMGVFLIGVWFVRSRIIEDAGTNLALSRKLAVYALPSGIGLGLLGSLIAVSHKPGDTNDGFQLARGLATLGNLPACLGYVGLVVVMLHSKSGLARIRVLAPVGRMALTNYLTQSLISTFVFYGHGLGHWGMHRAWQVVYVAVFFALQVAFSHWWLARYRYGPMEWLWRGFTYRQTPAMRISQGTSMIKALSLGCIVALSSGVASAQPRNAPTPKARAPRPGKQAAPKLPMTDAPSATPDATPRSDGPAAQPTDGKPPGAPVAQPANPKADEPARPRRYQAHDRLCWLWHLRRGDRDRRDALVDQSPARVPDQPRRAGTVPSTARGGTHRVSRDGGGDGPGTVLGDISMSWAPTSPFAAPPHRAGPGRDRRAAGQQVRRA
jgi:uncharacterized protein